MTVRDVLRAKGSSEVFTISPQSTVAELLEVLAERNVGAIVVMDEAEQSILGIATERDLARKLPKVDLPLQAKVEEIMSREVTFCSPNDDFKVLMETMTNRRVRHIPVVEEGHILGLVSIGDAVKYRMDQLEFERDQLTNYVHG